jgi:hypothetical protein
MKKEEESEKRERKKEVFSGRSYCNPPNLNMFFALPFWPGKDYIGFGHKKN